MLDHTDETVSLTIPIIQTIPAVLSMYVHTDETVPLVAMRITHECFSFTITFTLITLTTAQLHLFLFFSQPQFFIKNVADLITLNVTELPLLFEIYLMIFSVHLITTILNIFCIADVMNRSILVSRYG